MCSVSSRIKNWCSIESSLNQHKGGVVQGASSLGLSLGDDDKIINFLLTRRKKLLDLVLTNKAKFTSLAEDDWDALEEADNSAENRDALGDDINTDESTRAN